MNFHSLCKDYMMKIKDLPLDTRTELKALQLRLEFNALLEKMHDSDNIVILLEKQAESL